MYGLYSTVSSLIDFGDHWDHNKSFFSRMKNFLPVIPSLTVLYLGICNLAANNNNCTNMEILAELIKETLLIGGMWTLDGVVIVGGRHLLEEIDNRFTKPSS